MYREQKNLVLSVEIVWQRCQNWFLHVQKNNLKTFFPKTFLNFENFLDFEQKVSRLLAEGFHKVNEPGKNICKCPEENFEILFKGYKGTLTLVFLGIERLSFGILAENFQQRCQNWIPRYEQELSWKTIIKKLQIHEVSRISEPFWTFSKKLSVGCQNRNIHDLRSNLGERT